MHDIIIIGGGAAGAAAALYALQHKLHTAMLLEDGGKAGTQQHIAGQLRPERLEGAQIVAAFQQQVAAERAIIYDRALAVSRSNEAFQVETQQHGKLQARTILVATGAAPIPLGVPGAQTLINHGVGYSATSHAQLFASKAVAVVGATPRALRGARELCRIAAQVYLLIADQAALSPQQQTQLERLPNLSLLFGYRLIEISGSASVERITIESDDGEPSWLRVDGVFADMGLLPNSAMVRQLVNTDAQGFIEVDTLQATSVPGVFAAGDVTTVLAEHILIAVGQGVRAAASAYDYLLAR
jgi:thioredoxin reductase